MTLSHRLMWKTSF